MVSTPASAAPFPRLITRDALPLETVSLARFLIGKWVVRDLPDGLAGGRIVETEAYTPDDPAAHAFKGRTPRNQSMFLEPGRAYVYLAYGVASMLNVSSELEGIGAGDLIRALEPAIGIAIMESRRPGVARRDLARGPGRLCASLDIDRSLDGLDLCRTGPLWLGFDDQPVVDIGVSRRIGITKGAESPLRFYLRGSRFISGPRSLSP